MQATTICEVDDALVEQMRKLRFRKAQTNAALISTTWGWRGKERKESRERDG